MVTFICYHCDKTLKKPQVEKHVQHQCRQPAKLICIDCKKMFTGNEHVPHISCLTEKQLYWGQYANKTQQPVKQPVRSEEQDNTKEDIKETNKSQNEWIGWKKRINQSVKSNKKQTIKLSTIQDEIVDEYIKIFPSVTKEEATEQFLEKVYKCTKFSIENVPYIVKKIKKE